MTAPSDIEQLVLHLRRQRYRVGQEACLQADIETYLTAAGRAFEREARLGPKDRIDFLLADGIGIEAKTRCAPRSIFRQLDRYAGHDSISAIILISGTAMGLPPAAQGKPLYFVSTGRASL